MANSELGEKPLAPLHQDVSTNDIQEKRSAASLVTWLQGQGWWVSLLATSLSIAAFVSTRATGRLDIVLNDEVGVTMVRDHLSVILPITFDNSGGSETRTVVTRISGVLTETNSADPKGREHQLRWTRDVEFVGLDQYFAKYPEKARSDTKVVDALEYSRRAVSFPIAGNSATTKVLMLESRDRGTVSALPEIRLVIRVEDARRSVHEVAETYRCHGTLTAITRWCQRH